MCTHWPVVLKHSQWLCRHNVLTLLFDVTYPTGSCFTLLLAERLSFSNGNLCECS